MPWIEVDVRYGYACVLRGAADEGLDELWLLEARQREPSAVHAPRLGRHPCPEPHRSARRLYSSLCCIAIL